MLDVPVLLVISIACIPILLSGMRVVRLEGLFLLVLYLAYIATLFLFVPGWFGAVEGSG
jgi:Ca2+/Na+ antiporter